jgi:hypothetical protein
MTGMTRSIPTVLRVLLALVRRSVRTESFALLFVLTVPAQPLQARRRAGSVTTLVTRDFTLPQLPGGRLLSRLFTLTYFDTEAY